MIGPIGGYLIGSGISSIGSWIQNLLNRNSADRTYQKNLDLMNYQNEYNSPVAQMNRLKQAGINPMVVIGGGNVSGNLTGSVPRYDEPQKVVDTSGGASGAAAIAADQQVKLSKTLQDKAEADIEATNQRTENAKILWDVLQTEGKTKAFNLSQLEALAPYNLQIKQQLAEQAVENTKNIISLGGLREQERKTKIAQRSLIMASIAEKVVSTEKQRYLLEMLKKGITPQDPWYTRVIQSVMSDLGIKSWSDLWKVFENTADESGVMHPANP